MHPNTHYYTLIFSFTIISIPISNFTCATGFISNAYFSFYSGMTTCVSVCVCLCVCVHLHLWFFVNNSHNNQFHWRPHPSLYLSGELPLHDNRDVHGHTGWGPSRRAAPGTSPQEEATAAPSPCNKSFSDPEQWVTQLHKVNLRRLVSPGWAAGVSEWNPNLCIDTD